MQELSRIEKNCEKNDEVLTGIDRLEYTILKLEEIENLLDLMEENFFDLAELPLNDENSIYDIQRTFKLKQSLFYTIEKCYKDYLCDIKKADKEICEYLDKLRNEKK